MALNKHIPFLLLLFSLLTHLSACTKNKAKTEDGRASCQGLAYEHAMNKWLIRGYGHLRFGPNDTQFTQELKALFGDKPTDNAKALAYGEGQKLAQKHLPAFVESCTKAFMNLPTEKCNRPESKQRYPVLRRGLQELVEVYGNSGKRLDLEKLQDKELLDLMVKRGLTLCQ